MKADKYIITFERALVKQIPGIEEEMKGVDAYVRKKLPRVLTWEHIGKAQALLGLAQRLIDQAKSDLEEEEETLAEGVEDTVPPDEDE
jgi:hypothetical protein